MDGKQGQFSLMNTSILKGIESVVLIYADFRQENILVDLSGYQEYVFKKSERPRQDLNLESSDP